MQLEHAAEVKGKIQSVKTHVVAHVCRGEKIGLARKKILILTPYLRYCMLLVAFARYGKIESLYTDYF